MGTNTLVTASDGSTILSSHINQFSTAIDGDLVPRNASSIATDEAGDLGSSTYTWNELYIGGAANGISLSEDSGEAVVKVGGNESFRFADGYAFIPRTIQNTTPSTALGEYYHKTDISVQTTASLTAVLATSLSITTIGGFLNVSLNLAPSTFAGTPNGWQFFASTVSGPKDEDLLFRQHLVVHGGTAAYNPIPGSTFASFKVSAGSQSIYLYGAGQNAVTGTVSNITLTVWETF